MRPFRFALAFMSAMAIGLALPEENGDHADTTAGAPSFSAKGADPRETKSLSLTIDYDGSVRDGTDNKSGPSATKGGDDGWRLAAGYDVSVEERDKSASDVRNSKDEPWSPLANHVVISAKECSRNFVYTHIVGGVRSTAVVLGADFEGSGREENFRQFGSMNLVTHCNFIFYPIPPFDGVAVKVDYYRHICENSLTFCLVDNATISDIGLEHPFFCGIQKLKHLLSQVGRRERPCAAVVRDFFVPFPSNSEPTPSALVVQFHVLHNPIENVTLRLTAHKRGETAASCRRLKGDLKEEEEEEKAEVASEGDEDEREAARRRGIFPLKRLAAEEEEDSSGRRVKRLYEGFVPQQDGEETVGKTEDDDDAFVDKLSAELNAEEVETPRDSPRFDGFWCGVTRLCIWKNSTCDGFDSCLDGGSDEVNCEPETTTITTSTLAVKEGITPTPSTPRQQPPPPPNAAARNMVESKNASSAVSTSISKNASFPEVARMDTNDDDDDDDDILSNTSTSANAGTNVWFTAFVSFAVITVFLTLVVIGLIVRNRRRRGSVNPFVRRSSARVTAVDAEVAGRRVEGGDGAHGRRSANPEADHHRPHRRHSRESDVNNNASNLESSTSSFNSSGREEEGGRGIGGFRQLVSKLFTNLLRSSSTATADVGGQPPQQENYGDADEANVTSSSSDDDNNNNNDNGDVVEARRGQSASSYTVGAVVPSLIYVNTNNNNNSGRNDVDGYDYDDDGDDDNNSARALGPPSVVEVVTRGAGARGL